MVRITLGEALEREDEQQEQCIYLYKDGSTIFYVGRSIAPFERLRQHLGKGTYTPYPDAIGYLILDNHPDSLAWIVEIAPLQEIAPRAYEQATSEHAKRELAERVERLQIERCQPCLNGMHKRYSNPLPAQYIKQHIANEGVNLG